MKKLIFLMILIFSMLSISFAAEESLVLKPNLEMKLGELSGAGSRFSMKKLAGFVHPNGVIMKEECQEIELKTLENPKVSDVIRVHSNGTVIEASELTGFIIEK